MPTKKRTSSSSSSASSSASSSLSSASSSMNPDWSFLPDELLPIISKNVEDCFDLVHARSVSNLWRSIFPFPSSLLRPSYSLPTFDSLTLETKDLLCTLEKVPLFLFRVKNPPVGSPFEYFLGGIGQDKSEDRMELPSPLQFTVKVKTRGYHPALMNVADCQIISLGYQYRLIGWEPKDYRGAAFIPLTKEGRRGEFVVILNYINRLVVLRSAEMKWKRLENVPRHLCSDLVTFRGRFYVSFISSIFVIDPYSLESSLLTYPVKKPVHYLVASGNEELFLVEVTIPKSDGVVVDFNNLTCRVSRLDEEAGKWVEITDLGDRILFIGPMGNVSCLAKELPHGCGLSGNSILFTDLPGGGTFAYKYGVHTGNVEDDLNCWRYSRENHVRILEASPTVALQVDRSENLASDSSDIVFGFVSY